MALGRSQVALLLCAFLLAGAAAEIMRAPLVCVKLGE